MNKREYAQANKDWLESKAREDGVKALPKGIYYKVITEGNNDGKHPTPRSVVTAHYAGWTINGKKFDSSRGGTPQPGIPAGSTLIFEIELFGIA